jgi:SAM-dependent methyltransferase
MAGKATYSLHFLFAGMLLGIMSLVALPIVAKEEKQKQAKEARAFLANKRRALAYYNVLSTAYDLMNPYLYTSSMRSEVINIIAYDQSLQVLDVGCGTGYTTACILRLGSIGEVVGVDQNQRQLQRATRNLTKEKTRLSLSNGDVENLPFKDESFDAVVSVGAVEYFPDPKRALKEMTRVVKHGGRVVVGGPEYNWFKKTLLHKIFYAPTRNEFKDVFHRTGLAEVRLMLIGVPTFFGTDRYVLIAAGTKK